MDVDQKYRIDRTNRTNQRMLATVDLQRGDLILSEDHLIGLDVGPRRIFSSDDFYDIQSKYHGALILEQRAGELTEAKRAALFALHRKPGIRNKYLALTWGNSFERHVKVGNVGYFVVEIFDNISRINHSCCPNAVYDWNPLRGEEGQGTIYATKPISAGNEITICYFPNVKDWLKSGSDRNKELEENYDFTCSCEACTGRVRWNTADDTVRKDTRLLQRQILADSKKRLEGEHDFTDHDSNVHLDRSDQLKRLWSYINNLKRLGTADGKLADAYTRLAEFHEAGFRHADPAGTAPKCQDCGYPIHPREHLDKAIEARTEVLRIDTVRLGARHPEVESEQRRRNDLEALRIPTQSPVIPAQG